MCDRNALVPALVVALAACGSSPPVTPDGAVLDAHVPDGRADAPLDAPEKPPLDFTCLNQPPPATAPDPLLVGGKLFAIEHYQVAALAGATVVLRRRANDAPIAQAQTAADGAFEMSVASGGEPVDGYFTIDAPGFAPSRIDPGDPLFDGEGPLLAVATGDEMARWYADAGLPATGTGAILTATVDCANDAGRGATLALAPPAALAYYDDVAQRWDPALAASENGFALVARTATSF
ncbi:MAG: hypothetical protein KIT31_21425, partial [Deltaproteobacteria bacterium]|nr:hypothetical protein [Deltaproteobacteria bacterium]